METNQTGLSDNQRRFVCRMVFLLVCFFPTFIAVYTIFHQPTAQDWKHQIQSRLPIKVEIASVETPLPNRVLLRGLKVIPSDSNSYPELDGFMANEVSIEFGFLQNEIRFLEPVEIESQALASMLQRGFSQLDESALNDERWHVSFSKVLLRDSRYGTQDFLLEPLSLKLQTVSSTLDPDKRTFEARILARPQGVNPDGQISLLFKKPEGQKKVYIDTQMGAMPANLLKHLIADAPEMGASSLFRGIIDLEFDVDNHMNGTVTGDIANLRLDKLPDHRKRLTGFCDVHGLACQIREGRIESGQMTVRSNNTISVDRSLFEEANHFGIEVSGGLDGQRIPIARLEIGMSLQEGNVTFAAPKVSVNREDKKYVEECFAFDSLGRPLAICNGPFADRKSLPLVSLAKMLTGQESGNQPLEFLDNFNLPPRTARQTENRSAVQ